MTNNDNFTDAASEEASARFLIDADHPGPTSLAYCEVFEAGAEWARTHLAAQDVTQMEALAYLDASCEELPDAFEWTPDTIARVRRGLSAARAARRDEE